MILVTGAAGFIGRAVCERLAGLGAAFTGVDLDPAGDQLKLDRILTWDAGGPFRICDVAELEAFEDLVAELKPAAVIHLAAQAGVRYSIENPLAYLRANIQGQLSVVEALRRHAPAAQLLYASSSSVYGERPGATAFRETDPIRPASYYAASKASAEATTVAHCQLYGLRATALRFFTVYGPWGRPDMACWLFADAIRRGTPIDVYGEGRMARDLTYVDDVVDALLGLLEAPAALGEHRILNVGAEAPVNLAYMVRLIEEAVGSRAVINLKPMQAGDVSETFANAGALRGLTGWRPKVDFHTGVGRFVDWLQAYAPLQAAAA